MSSILSVVCKEIILISAAPRLNDFNQQCTQIGDTDTVIILALISFKEQNSDSGNMVVLVIMTHLNAMAVTHDSNLLAEFILFSINLSGAKFMNKMSASVKF